MSSGFINPSGGALLIVNRLSEIATAGAAAQAAARTNLGIGAASTVQHEYLGLGMARALGRLQIVAGATSADGIWFGSDFAFYRTAAGFAEMTAAGANVGLNLKSADAAGICSIDLYNSAGVARDWQIRVGGSGSGANAGSFVVRHVTAGTFPLIIGTGDAATFSGDVSVNGTTGLQVAAGSVLGFTGRSRITSAADGILVFTNNSLNDFTRHCYGGTTSSYPAFRRASANLDLVAADASAWSDLNLGNLGLQPSGTTKGYISGGELTGDPAAPTANNFILYAKDNGAGKTQLCVRFNTGAVQVLATEP